MKVLFVFLAILLNIQQAYSYTSAGLSSTKDYFPHCQQTSFNKESVCYAFFEGVVSTMTLGNVYLLCFKQNSDREIYENVLKKSNQYLRANPDANIFTSATILYHSLLALYSCDDKGSTLIK